MLKVAIGPGMDGMVLGNQHAANFAVAKATSKAKTIRFGKTHPPLGKALVLVSDVSEFVCRLCCAIKCKSDLYGIRVVNAKKCCALRKLRLLSLKKVRH